MFSFSDNVKEIVKKIPKGKTMSYGEVARKAGNKNGARAVGAIMKANRNPQIPCHRVIRSDGSPGGFNRGTKKKIELLKSEGVRM